MSRFLCLILGHCWRTETFWVLTPSGGNGLAVRRTCTRCGRGRDR